MKIIKKLSFLFLSLITISSFATEYNQLKKEKSSINFNYEQMGVKMDGSFKSFNAQLNFNPSNINNTKAAFDVDLSSINTGSEEADSEIIGKQWFNVKSFPTAKFVSNSMKYLNGSKYEVYGNLTIKGKTKEILLPVEIITKDNISTFDGLFIIHRGDFTIGEGEWSKFDLVANDVRVKFHLTVSGK